MSMVNTKKNMNFNSCRVWLIQHCDDEVRRFLQKYYDVNSLDLEFQRMLQDPVASYQLILQDQMSNSNKWNYFMTKLTSPGGYICIVSGGKGSGKSALIAEVVYQALQRGCKIAYVGMPQSVPLFLNENPIIKKNGGEIKFYYDFFSVPEGYIIVQDESAIIENAKNFQDKQQKQREDILPILRHKGNSVIYISQQFKFLSKRIRDFADYFIFKQYNLMALLKDDGEGEFPFPQIYLDFIPKDQNHLLFVDGLTGVYSISHDVPKWYIENSDLYGKSFKNIENDDEALGFIKALVDNGYDAERVRHFLRLRGYDKPLSWYEELLEQDTP